MSARLLERPEPRPALARALSLVNDPDEWMLRASSRIVTAMAQVDLVPPRATGALVVGVEGLTNGFVLVERNRVCWAAAAGMGRRLADILRSRASLPISDDDLEALFARCRAEQRPLGEALVESAVVAPEQMRAAMKQHTVESVLALDAACFAAGHAEWPLSWVDRSERTYNPRYTFTPAEILGAVGATLLDDTLGELVGDHLDALAATGGALAAFAAELDGSPVVVGSYATMRLPIPDLMELAHWAGAALEASAGFSPALAHAVARSAEGGAVAWSFEGHVCAAVCPNRQALQRLVVALDNRSLAMVLATRHPVLERVRERMAIAAG